MEEIQLHASCYLCRGTLSSFCTDCVIPGKNVPLSTVKERVYTLQTVWRRRRREQFNSGIITRQLARSRSPYWAIEVTDDDDDCSNNKNNKTNNWHYIRQLSILYKSPLKQERSTMKYKWQWILSHCSSEDDASSSYRFLILSNNYRLSVRADTPLHVWAVGWGGYVWKDKRSDRKLQPIFVR